MAKDNISHGTQKTVTVPPIVSIVGKSDSGKTTLIEKLLKELLAKGYRVATIKHDAHSFDVDHAGKDTWRHREAGAAAVVIASSSRLFLTRNLDVELTVEQIRDRYLAGDYDIIITEGFRNAPTSKIEVHRSARSSSLICDPNSDLLIAVVSDTDWELSVPVFTINDGPDIAAFIEKTFLNR